MDMARDIASKWAQRYANGYVRWGMFLATLAAAAVAGAAAYFNQLDKCGSAWCNTNTNEHYTSIASTTTFWYIDAILTVTVARKLELARDIISLGGRKLRNRQDDLAEAAQSLLNVLIWSMLICALLAVGIELFFIIVQTIANHEAALPPVPPSVA